MQQKISEIETIEELLKLTESLRKEEKLTDSKMDSIRKRKLELIKEYKTRMVGYNES